MLKDGVYYVLTREGTSFSTILFVILIQTMKIKSRNDSFKQIKQENKVKREVK